MVNGLSGERMLIGLAVGIAVLIFLVLKTKIQAFLALIISTVVVGVIGGMPLTNITIEVDGVEKTFEMCIRDRNEEATILSENVTYYEEAVRPWADK